MEIYNSKQPMISDICCFILFYRFFINYYNWSGYWFYCIYNPVIGNNNSYCHHSFKVLVSNYDIVIITLQKKKITFQGWEVSGQHVFVTTSK